MLKLVSVFLGSHLPDFRIERSKKVILDHKMALFLVVQMKNTPHLKISGQPGSISAVRNLLLGDSSSDEHPTGTWFILSPPPKNFP